MPDSSKKKTEYISHEKITFSPITPKYWIKLSVLLPGLSNSPLLFWITRDVRTSSTSIILLNFLSWSVTSSWMYHVSRQNTLQETSYKVLSKSSCRCYHYMLILSHGSPGCSRNPALLQHGSRFWTCHKNKCICGKGHCRWGWMQYLAWNTARKVPLWYISQAFNEFVSSY